MQNLIFVNYSNLYNMFLKEHESKVEHDETLNSLFSLEPNNEVFELMLQSLEQFGLTVKELEKIHHRLRFEPIDDIKIIDMDNYLNVLNFFQFNTMEEINLRILDYIALNPIPEMKTLLRFGGLEELFIEYCSYYDCILSAEFFRIFEQPERLLERCEHCNKNFHRYTFQYCDCKTCKGVLVSWCQNCAWQQPTCYICDEPVCCGTDSCRRCEMGFDKYSSLNV